MSMCHGVCVWRISDNDRRRENSNYESAVERSERTKARAKSAIRRYSEFTDENYILPGLMRNLIFISI